MGPLRPHTLAAPSTTTITSSSSSVPPFPSLTRQQHAQIDRILALCHPQDHSWAHLSAARQRALAQTARDAEEDDDDDQTYQLLLALTWQEGTTWHQKWASAQRATEAGHGSHAQPPRRHARRPSDGVDLLKSKLAQVSLDPTPRASASPSTSAHVAPPRRTPSTPLDPPHPRHSSSSALPPSSRPLVRPRSTPPVAARPLLVHPSAAGAGYSSSDDYFSPPEAHALASQFARLRLVGVAFDAWAARAEFVRARERDVAQRRGRWLVRCAVEGWRDRLTRVRELEARAEAAEAARIGREGKERRRVLLGAVGRWKARLERKREDQEEERRREERERREAELKGARDEVVRLRNRGMGRRALEHWYNATLSHRAARFRRLSLLRLSLSSLSYKLHAHLARSAELAAVADERWESNERARAKGAVGEWRRRWRIREAERAVVGRTEEREKREVVEVWADKTRQARYLRDLDAAADQHYATRLASGALDAWKRRKRHVEALAFRSTQHSRLLLLRHSTSLLHHWRLTARLSLSLRSSSLTLLSTALDRWLSAHERVAVSLSGRADAFACRKDAELARAALAGWKDSAAHRARLSSAAEAVSRRSTLARSFGRWRAQHQHQELQRRKADVVREFMGQRAAWRVWQERAVGRRRERWVEGKRRERGREALLFWHAQTKQKQQDRQLVAQVQQRSDRRILSSALATWKERVILRREIEVEADKLYETRVLQSGFKRWGEQTVRAAERLLVADEHRALKLEELRDRSFHHWRLRTSRSLELKQRLEAFVQQRESREREEMWGRWREGRLRKIEEEVREKREVRVRREGWVRWKGRSKSLIALQFRHQHLLSRALQTWIHWTPPPSFTARAAQADAESILRGRLAVWAIKARAKTELKGWMSGGGRLRRSFGAATAGSVSPPTRATAGASMMYSRLSSPAAEEEPTPTPSPLIRRHLGTSPALTPGASSPSSAMPAVATPSVSRSPLDHLSTPSRLPVASSSSSPSPSSAFSRLSPSTTAPSTAATTAPPSSTSPFSRARRPSLSAEYAASPLPSLPRPRSRTATRDRSRSISSLRSVQTSQSAPLGSRGRDLETDEEEEDDAEEDEPGRRRTAARSEGGSEGRNVRGEFDALKRRLREAAVRARTGGGER
ncbi:hypothetical protein JCM8097_005802 [Rhodosporidiobolus ruineniae]